MSEDKDASTSVGSSLLAKAKSNIEIQQKEIDPLKASLDYMHSSDRKIPARTSQRDAQINALAAAYELKGMSPQAAREKAENDAKAEN